ncbi:MAG: PEP-CTERM sorting domain-containing protein, partial [Okeania sp. SIO2H7]|nr:PEP-CTERM sorting domain-containing protein [Okeania sp. SIO2H7]
LYPNGIASITISVESQSVPESSTTVGLMAMVGLFVFGGLRRRNHHFN